MAISADENSYLRSFLRPDIKPPAIAYFIVAFTKSASAKVLHTFSTIVATQADFFVRRDMDWMSHRTSPHFVNVCIIVHQLLLSSPPNGFQRFASLPVTVVGNHSSSENSIPL